MGAFSQAELRQFIRGYNPGDEALVRFEWNGKHAERFEDRNYEFRKEVLAEVLADLRAAPLELVCDLYRAETTFSKQAWCIDLRVGRLAEHLLREGGDRFIEDYLEGKGRSFDASLAVAAFPVDLPLAERLLRAVQERLLTERDEWKLALLRVGEETFRRWAEGLQGQP
jgi:hypothetical protein